MCNEKAIKPSIEIVLKPLGRDPSICDTDITLEKDVLNV